MFLPPPLPPPESATEKRTKSPGLGKVVAQRSSGMSPPFK